MFEIADRLLGALATGTPLAVATAVSISGSAPRTIGTSMAFDGTAVFGSIAGGCVEGAVVGVCEEVLSDGKSRTVEYGISDETAFGVGLSCGGELRIHVQRVDADSPIVAQLRLAAEGSPAGIATVIEGGNAEPDVRAGIDAGAHPDPNPVAETAARFAGRIDAERRARIVTGQSGLGSVDCDGLKLETFFEVAATPARMIIFGAMEFSTALSQAARVLGYRVTVCDPRSLFATAERFPGVEVVVSWPTDYLTETPVDERTVICVLSHDDRFDSDLVEIALAGPAAYVGAMGSRRTSDQRFADLRSRGVSEESLARLHSPIGLDVGASTPEETAVSILAEVLATRAAKPGSPLAATHGSIHRG
jgi:xanthine dehydrogenase accessory factor